MNNWKVPGNDCVQNFWHKCLINTHAKFALLFNQCILELQQVPGFFTKGITCLKPKDENSENPSKYHPITCLPTIYKMLTSIISDKLNSHLKTNNRIAEEQKGCKINCQGCREQVIIDTVITTHAKTKKRNLYNAYTDYQKAFDSVPHSWLIHILQIYKVEPVIVNFLQVIMKN
jgi:hypothetical protein